MCTTHSFCCFWQKKASTSPLELLQASWTLLVYIQVSFSAALSAVSALVTHLLHLSTGVLSSMEWLRPKHSRILIILFHTQLINLLLLTLVFLLSWANFSSWAASIFSKSRCFFSNSSTSDTESWMEKLSDMEVQNQVYQKRLYLRFSSHSI